jgi:clan AA aspartic protease
MLGTFDNDQPKIEIEVKGVNGSPKKVTALVDSGFNGYLTLPYVEAFPLGLVLTGIQSNILADGSSSSHLVCIGQICLGGKCVTTTVDIQPANIILLGTKLLKELEKTFILDCLNGKVEIIDSIKKS